jgi:NADPH:quinone reductase-like Zn-dependent oxidoreductase
MKAAIVTQYGPPDVIRVEDVEKPVPGDNEVLIAVRAAAINPFDKYFRQGRYLIRPITGLRRPKHTRMGADLAGRVEAVGKQVTQFKPGDEVFGVGRGSVAEYVCTIEGKIAPKPASITFEEAAAVPAAGCTALQGLRNAGRIQSGQKVLIVAAAGGVGSFAVQIAKAFGATVTAVCSTKSVEMVRSIGADRVIDYKREDFTESGERYDLILDSAGDRPIAAIRRVMTPAGIYLMNAGASGGVLGPFPRIIGARILSAFVKQTLTMFSARIDQKDLLALKDLIDAKKVRPVIDRKYALADVVAAMRYFEEGHASGKVVITI